MRATIRYIATAIWFFVAIIVGTVFRQNIEEFASDHGWNDALSQWWLGMTGASYSTFLLLGFVALTGAVATLWIDAVIRNYISHRRAKQPRRVSFKLNLKTGDYDDVASEGLAGFTVLRDIRDWKTEAAMSDPKISGPLFVVTMIYEHPTMSSEVVVSCDKDVIYKVFCNDSKFSYIDLDFQGSDNGSVDVDVFVYPARKFGVNVHSWEQHWHDAVLKVANRAHQSPLDTAKETPPRTRPG